MEVWVLIGWLASEEKKAHLGRVVRCRGVHPTRELNLIQPEL